MVYSVQPTVISTVYSGPSGVQSLYGRLPSYPGTVTVPLYCLGPYGVLLDCHSLAGFVGPYHSLHSDCDPGPTVPYRSGFHSQGWGPAGPDVTPSAPGLSVGPYGYRGWPGANPPGRPVAGPSAGSSWGQPAGLLAPGNPSASWLAVRGPAGPSASWLAPRPAGSPVAVRLLARGPSAGGWVAVRPGPASRGCPGRPVPRGASVTGPNHSVPVFGPKGFCGSDLSRTGMARPPGVSRSLHPRGPSVRQITRRLAQVTKLFVSCPDVGPSRGCPVPRGCRHEVARGSQIARPPGGWEVGAVRCP